MFDEHLSRPEKLGLLPLWQHFTALAIDFFEEHVLKVFVGIRAFYRILRGHEYLQRLLDTYVHRLTHQSGLHNRVQAMKVHISLFQRDYQNFLHGALEFVLFKPFEDHRWVFPFHCSITTKDPDRLRPVGVRLLMSAGARRWVVRATGDATPCKAIRTRFSRQVPSWENPSTLFMIQRVPALGRGSGHLRQDRGWLGDESGEGEGEFQSRLRGRIDLVVLCRLKFPARLDASSALMERVREAFAVGGPHREPIGSDYVDTG